MTSLQVTHNWTPQLIAQDKALKEKNGNGAHMIPASSYVSTLNSASQDQFSTPTTIAKDNKDSKKKAWFAAAALLSTAAAITAFVLTRGKKVPANSQINSTANAAKNKIDNYLGDLAKNNATWESTPVITNLKNGGFKYEFKNPAYENTTNVFIFDKTGQFKQYITFSRDAGNRISSYNAYSKPIEISDYLVKSVDIKRKSLNKFATKINDEINITLRDKDGSLVPAGTNIKGSDKVIFVDRRNTVRDDSPSTSTSMFFDKGKNVLTTQTVDKPNGYVDYVIRPGQPKTKVDSWGDYLSEQQRGDMFELLHGKRDIFKKS